MACIDNEEKLCLIEAVKTELGAPVVKVEITNDMWCNLLQKAVRDYVLEMQTWLIKNQWSNLNYKDITKTDICFALTTRSFDSELKFSQAFTKQTQGIATSTDWVLKKDFIQLEEGKQSYEIPAGREINEVLWLTPSSIDQAIGNSLGFGTSLGGGTSTNYVGTPFGSQSLGGQYYVAPAYDIILRAADYGMKDRMMRSDLIYKISAGENGTKILHLFSTPNNGNDWGIRKELYKCRVWYHYYETPTPDAKNKCLDACKDVIKYPSDVPLTDMDYCDLNMVSKQFVRRFLYGYAQRTLANIRGKFNGNITAMDNALTLNYELSSSEATRELEEVKREVKEWLAEMNPEKIAEKKAQEAENLNKLLSYVPNGIFIF